MAIRLLLLEDCADDAELLAIELKFAGLDHELRRTSDEAGFRLALAEWAPDIVVSDANLPAFSGAQALRLVRAMERPIPFILLSGAIDDDDRGANVDTSRGPDARVGKHAMETVPALVRQLART